MLGCYYSLWNTICWLKINIIQRINVIEIWILSHCCLAPDHTGRVLLAVDIGINPAGPHGTGQCREWYGCVVRTSKGWCVECACDSGYSRDRNERHKWLQEEDNDRTICNRFVAQMKVCLVHVGDIGNVQGVVTSQSCAICHEIACGGRSDIVTGSI